MEPIKPIKFTIERTDEPNEKLELTAPGDGDLEDLEHIFRVIMKWLTYGDETIDEMFGHKEYDESPLT